MEAMNVAAYVTMHRLGTHELVVTVDGDEPLGTMRGYVTARGFVRYNTRFDVHRQEVNVAELVRLVGLGAKRSAYFEMDPPPNVIRIGDNVYASRTAMALVAYVMECGQVRSGLTVHDLWRLAQ